jgi:hypothetical protein
VWEEEERSRAVRTGVLLCRDLRVVAQAIAPEGLRLAGDERRKAFARNNGMVDALRFAASEACWSTLRRVFGQG